MAMLQVTDLKVNYGVIQAIKGVSFEVNEGEVIASSEQRSRKDHDPSYGHRPDRAEVR